MSLTERLRPEVVAAARQRYAHIKAVQAVAETIDDLTNADTRLDAEWLERVAEAAVAAAEPHLTREAKVSALRQAALSLEIGQLVGARQLDAMADRIERGQA